VRLRPVAPLAAAPRRPGSRLAAALSLSLVLAWAGAALGSPKLDIDRVDADDFVKSGKIKIYFDLLDDDFNVISGLKDDKVKILIDGKEVPGTVKVETFAQAKEWLGVAILMAGHRSYAALEANTDDEGGAVEGPPEVFGLEKQGFSRFVRKLSGDDKVGVYIYNEQTWKPIRSFTTNQTSVADDIMEKAKLLDAEDEQVKQVVAPKFYAAVRGVVEKMKEAIEAGDFPRRRVLVLMSDGKDAKAVKASLADKQIKRIAEMATDNGIKVYCIGFTMDDPDPLTNLGELASKTHGIYREIKPDPKKMLMIPDIIENIAVELKKQYVVTFTPSEDFNGAEKPVKVRVEVVTPDKEQAGGEMESVRIKEKPTNWVKYLIWAGIILGSLLGIFLLIKLIRGILAARANRPVEVYEEDEGPVGPYKGKLTVTKGSYAGAEFYLTEDVTTIGSLEGNTIVLEEAGVSKRHAGIKIEDMRFELADFGSTNGTFVNGNKLTKQFLRDGDNIKIGECEMTFTLK